MLNKEINRYCFLFATTWMLFSPIWQQTASAQKIKNSEKVIRVDSVKTIISGVHAGKDKASFLGAENTVYTDQLTSTMGTTIIPALMGRMPGLNISQYRGARLHQSAANYEDIILGQQAPKFGSTVYSDNTEFDITSRGKAPVVIIDGVQRDLYSIDPEAIESVSIQKDALSTLFLGMRSSRGALVITTRKPDKEGFHLSFTGRFGVLSSVKKPKPLPAYQ